MDGVTFFHYIHKKTILHQMDGRLKLFCMLLLTFSASLASNWHHYSLLMIVIVSSLVISKLPVITILKEMKFFAILLMIILLMSGWLLAGRLILMLMIGIVMTGTTSLSTLKNAIEWYLRPIPFVPEVQIATMINLTFVLIPLIFDHYVEMMNAQKSRGIELSKNPIRRVKFTALPLLERTLRRADEMVYAMESRSYTHIRTKPTFKTSLLDWLILTICTIVSVAVVWLF